MADRHEVTVETTFYDDTYDVVCGCGFKVEGLVDAEAAHEAVRQHYAYTDAGAAGSSETPDVTT